MPTAEDGRMEIIMGNKYCEVVRKAKIIFLVENKSELLIRPKQIASYFTEKPLLAEPGLSLLVELNDNGEYILVDGGASDIVLKENARRMNIDIKKIKKIVLSHGHFDHTGSLTEIVRILSNNKQFQNWDQSSNVDEIFNSLNEKVVSIYAHPEAFRERWMIWDDGKKYGPLVTPKDEWKALGGNIVVSDKPMVIESGCYTTGYIPRKSFETFVSKGIKNVYRNDKRFIADDIVDEQGVVINVKNQGLIIISGCAHAGILNTIYAAQEITGENKILAVIGGFHLALATNEYIDSIINEFLKIGPKYIIPTHCTGFEAMKKISDAMEEHFLLGTVGSSFIFE